MSFRGQQLHVIISNSVWVHPSFNSPYHNCGDSAGQASFRSGRTGHCLLLYLLSSGNKGPHCAWPDSAENNDASGSDTVEPMVTRATQALVLSLQLCAVLLLIAESWLEWGENRASVWTRGFIERRDGRRARQGHGDGCSLGTEQLPISQLPLLDMGITEKAEMKNMHRCRTLSPACLLYCTFL